MNLHPTRATFHVALAGAAVIALGTAARIGAVVGFGAAMVLAIAIGRASALLAITRLRRAGFEMVWREAHRVVRVARGGTVKLRAELRNRGTEAVRGVAIRAVVSSMLEATTEPEIVDLPPGARVRIDVHVRGLRVGRWGVHGIALEVRATASGGDALYEVPLMFANPFGVEVLPPSLHAMLLSPRGGRSRRIGEVGRPANHSGEGGDLRELREHVPGDPFRLIAWKASARRGQLVVRELERDERDVVWFVLDASVELWAGPAGRAPLDFGVDEIASLAARHLRHGDRVGLAIVAARLRTWIPPGTGASHAMKLANAIAGAASMVDADRTELDEVAIAQRVAEHARPLDPRALADVPRGNLNLLAARSESLRSRAPFSPRMPFGRSPRDQRLRLYLAGFGIEVPPKLEGERGLAETGIKACFDRMLSERIRPSLVYVWAPAPPNAAIYQRELTRIRRVGATVRWSLPPFDKSISDDSQSGSPIGNAVYGAVRARTEAARLRGTRLLRKLGVAVPVGSLAFHRTAWGGGVDAQHLVDTVAPVADDTSPAASLPGPDNIPIDPRGT